VKARFASQMKLPKVEPHFQFEHNFEVSVFSWLLPRFNLILFGQSVTTGWRNSLASNDLAMLCNLERFMKS